MGVIVLDPTSISMPNPFGRFALSIRLDSSNFNFNAAKNQGEDLRIVTIDGTILPSEINNWDRANEVAELWVQLDTIPTSLIPLTIYWGNSTATNSNMGIVYPDVYTAVFHLDTADVDKISGVILERENTFYGNSVPGLFGAGIECVTGAGIGAKSYVDWGITNIYGLSLWFKPSNSPLTSVLVGDSTNAFHIGWGGLVPEAQVQFKIQTIQAPFEFRFASADLTLNEWHQATWVVNFQDSTVHAWIDGKRVLDSLVSGVGMLTPQGFMRVDGGGSDFLGIIDEIRVLNGVPSDEMIQLEYQIGKNTQGILDVKLQP